MIYNISIGDTKDIPPKLFEFIEKFGGNTLIISLIQENRFLEDMYDIVDEIIYDNSDYINGIISISKGIIEIDDNLDIIPSSYKMKKKDMDYLQITNDIEEENLEYENIIILYDNKLNILNSPKYYHLVESDNLDNSDNLIVIGKYNKKLVKNNNIVGFLNDSEEELSVLVDNLKNNKFLQHKEIGILRKIKGIFKNEK